MSHLSEATTRSPAPCTLSFEEFKKRKQINQSSVIAKNGKKKKANVKVKIQIGILHVVDGVLRKAKGRTLPVATNAAVNASEILQIAIDKHAKHFQQFNTACKYVLLYPDHTIVNTLPGSLSQRFTLESYKEDLGKTYAKIYLWLWLFVDLESDPEGDNLPPAFSEKRCNDNANKIPSITGHDKVASGNTSPSSSVVGPSNTIIPYLSSPTTSTNCESQQTVSALCPICSQSFPVEAIARHADLCADAFDPIGEILEQVEVVSDSDTDNNVDAGIPNCEAASQPSSSLTIQAIVTQLQKKVNLNFNILPV